MVVVAFVHPDLGIGGAERLVVDAALALKTRSHKVHIFTAHYDPSHCFHETKDGSIPVTCIGDWLPRHLFGYFYALFAYIRMIYVAFYLVMFSKYQADVVFCDQISACIPVLKLSKAKIVFYCHFPDQLLTKRQSFAKKLYRAPLDWLEEKTTGMANCILVNSNFTARTFFRTFTSLTNTNPRVLYPSLNFKAYNQGIDSEDNIEGVPATAKHIFLSINRFERKKNLQLALEAFAILKDKISLEKWKKTHLVMAGGYDERIAENKEHFIELVNFSKENNLTDHVTFIRSFSDQEKLALFVRCLCLIYTPTNEHFGIVPIEAMYMRRPVIAVNTGGPLETVIHGGTGFLCEPNKKAFSDAMQTVMEKLDLAKTLGEKGRDHVIGNFSFDAFSRNLDNIVMSLQKHDGGPMPFFTVLCMLILFGISAFVLLFFSS
ncbi:alpha-1,3/1,6-mannosyltransferase ALG2-like [Dendronephthya gigantea]|uniref:alpha-1,3/1,6-mannosyltransferase ALG2-like n=1 Tax=Dendronephthya gigantea TaxID=151771 RepID=UPI00106B6072|nr:alpha-1,3/1,6-mannosyltransferase ALG2-like [Dendronephthya gigantea]